MLEKFSEYFKKNIDLIIEILFLSLILLAPLFFDRRLGIVFSLSKATVIRIITFALLGLIATKFILNKRIAFAKTALDLPIVTYLLCVLAASINSINVYVSFAGSYGRYEGFITILNYVVLFFLTMQIVITSAARQRIMAASSVSGLAMALYGIIQRLNLDPYEWGGVVTNERIIATIGQPNFLAAYLDMAILLGLGLIISMDKNEKTFFNCISSKNKKTKPQRSLNYKEIFLQMKLASCFILIPAIFIYSLYIFKASDNFFGWVIAFLIIVGLTIYFVFNIEKIDSRIFKGLIIASIIFGLIGLFSTQSRGGILGFLCGFIIFIIISGRKSFFENKKLWISVGIVGIILIPLFSINVIKRFSGEIKIKKEEPIKNVAVSPQISGEKNKKSPKLELEGAAGSRIETWTSAVKLIADRPVLGIGPEVIKMLFPQYETPYFRYKEGFHVKQDRCHNETLDIALTKGTLTLFVYIALIFLVFRSGIFHIRENDKDSALVGGFLGGLTAYIVQNQFSFGVVAITSLFWVIIGMTAGLRQKEIVLISSKERKYQNIILILLWALIITASVISAFPYIADRFFKSAKTFSDSNMLKSAQKDFKAAVSITPYEPSTYTHYGMAKINLGQNNINDIKESIEIFKKGQSIDPYNADNFYMAGRAYLFLYEKGDKDAINQAEYMSERALKIDPYYAEAYQNLGIIYERKGSMDKAVEMYKKAFMSNPTLMYIAKTLYSYYSHIGKPLKIMDLFNKALSDNPNNAELLLMIGDIYNDSNLYSNAKEKYLLAISVIENSPNPNLNIEAKGLAGLGITNLKMGDEKTAFSKLQEAMIADPSEPLIHSGLGLYYLKIGDRERAREEFGQAESLGGQNAFIKKMLNKMK